MLSSYICYIQIAVLKEYKPEIKNHRSIHKHVFCKIDVLKNLTKLVENVCERGGFDISYHFSF